MYDSREAHDRFARGRERPINIVGDTVEENKDRGKGKRKRDGRRRLERQDCKKKFGTRGVLEW